VYNVAEQYTLRIFASAFKGTA